MQGAAPTSQDPRFIKHTGQFYRIVFAAYADKVLDGVIHSEGRFHKNGQTALYASPSHETASVAIDIYVKPGDADRVIVPLLLENARLADLRDRAQCTALGINPSWPSVPWADQRAAGQTPTSWLASDAVRQAGADGMIYSSRRAPSRWHVVLFSWNKVAGAQLRQNGPATTWVQPGATSV